MTTKLAVALCVLALGLPGVAAAQEDSESEKPWAKGVTAEQQKAALAVFREGNAALKDGVFADAAAKYREALGHWDHPAIHYNLALSLRTLDQPIEQREHLIAAMKFGPDPLEAAKFNNAKIMLEVVERQLARVQLKCEEPGAQVVMDGKQLFVAPGAYDGYVRPGPHTIVATKSGFLTYQASKSLPFGELSSFEIKLFRAADLTKYKRRWSQVVPWSVVAAGLVVGVAGGGMHYGAKASFDSFDQKVEELGGSEPTDTLKGQQSTGYALQSTAMVAYGVGGAALVTGAVLLYLNRLIPYQDTAPAPDAPKKKANEPEWGLAPIIGSDVQGVQATLRF